MPESKYYTQYLDPGAFPLWDQFVADHPFGTLFHSTAWGTLIKDTFGRTFSILAVFRNDEIRGGILFWPKNSVWLKSIPQTPLTSYQGVLIKEAESHKKSKAIAAEEEITGLILDELKSKYSFIELSLMRHIRDTRPYLWKGFTAHPSYSYCFPVEPIESLKSNFSQALRRKINRSEKEKHQITGSVETRFIVKFILESYNHHHIAPPVSSAKMAQLMTAALSQNIGRLYYLSVNDQPVAGIFLLVDKRRVYALFSGIDHSKRTEHFTEYLHAAILGRDEFAGKEFDFLGANTRDFEQFKRSFGGELQTYFKVRYLKNNGVALLLKFREKQHLLARRRLGSEFLNSCYFGQKI